MGNFLNSIMLNAQTLQTDAGAVEFISNMDLGLLTTVLGLIIVFTILIIIALLLAIFSVLVKDKNKPVQAQQIAMPAKAAASTSSDLMDDKELVAVITAAIAASMNTSADTLVVRRIRRVGSWNKEAIEEQQNSIYY